MIVDDAGRGAIQDAGRDITHDDIAEIGKFLVARVILPFVGVGHVPHLVLTEIAALLFHADRDLRFRIFLRQPRCLGKGLLVDSEDQRIRLGDQDHIPRIHVQIAGAIGHLP